MRSLINSPAPERRLVFDYDWKGRRIHQTVWNDRDDGQGSELSDMLYAYDGWNLLAELDANASNARIRTYLWGLDLSGSEQGAGGVGGLLEVVYYGTATTNCFVAFDGNGNVGALYDVAHDNIVARYEYGPFGELLRATGPMAKANPFRFSTKYQDEETDLLYYGYRYYNASTGRWLTRDPFGELIAPNLYHLIYNNSVNNVDVLGLCKCGDIQNRQCQRSTSPAQSTPEKDEWLKKAAKKLGSLEDAEFVLNLAAIALGGGELSLEKAIETAIEKVAEKLSKPDAEALAHSLAQNLKQYQGSARGWDGYTKMTWELCNEKGDWVQMGDWRWFKVGQAASRAFPPFYGDPPGSGEIGQFSTPEDALKSADNECGQLTDKFRF